MEKKIKDLVEKTKMTANAAKSIRELTDLKVEALGKNGALTGILRGLKDLSAEQRPIMGKIVNEAREELEAFFGVKLAELERKELDEKLAHERIDISIDKNLPLGKLHPLNVIKRMAIDFVVSLGFMVADSP